MNNKLTQYELFLLKDQEIQMLEQQALLSGDPDTVYQWCLSHPDEIPENIVMLGLGVLERRNPNSSLLGTFHSDNSDLDHEHTMAQIHTSLIIRQQKSLKGTFKRILQVCFRRLISYITYLQSAAGLPCRKDIDVLYAEARDGRRPSTC